MARDLPASDMHASAAAADARAELTDLVLVAIQDSLGPDWSSADGAHYVVSALLREGPAVRAAIAKATGEASQ